MSDPTLERWRGFLAKIAQRMEEVLTEADQGFTDLLPSSPTDTGTVGNAMQGIRFRVQALTSKISDTWSDQVSDQMSGGNMDTAIAMMEDAQDALDARWERWRCHWEAQQYRNMWPLVQEAMNKPISCNKCGGPLQKATPHAMETIHCGSCRAVNNVFPEALVGQYFGGAAHAFAEQAAIEKRIAISAQRRQADRWRKGRSWADEPIESLRQYEAMERDYWATYFGTKAQIVPSPPEEQAKDVESRMRHFYESMQHQNAWRKAAGMPVRD